MKVVFEPSASAELRLQVEALVHSQLDGARASGEVSVFVARGKRGRWSVFISGLSEHPLAPAQRLEAALNGES